MSRHSYVRPIARTFLVALLIPLVAAGAQQPPAKKAPPPAATEKPPVVTLVKVNAIDYAFSTPETTPAGIVTFNVVNNGADLHAMAVFELPPNHTLKEFLDQYHAHGIIPVWMVSLGQTPTFAPKTEVFLTVRMKPGRYILACLIPAQDGRMHTEKGMVTMMTVK
jgi:hypothetical protein